MGVAAEPSEGSHSLLLVLNSTRCVDMCYDPGSSLLKRNDLQGKDGSTSVLRNLTNGVARADADDDISRTGTSGSKGESLTTVAEVGAEDTGSDGYR